MNPRLRGSVATKVLLAAVLLTGCGGNVEADTEETSFRCVAKEGRLGPNFDGLSPCGLVENYFNSVETGSAETACAHWTLPDVGGECEAHASHQGGLTKQVWRTSETEAEEIDERKARVTVSLGGDRPGVFYLSRLQNAWKIAYLYNGEPDSGCIQVLGVRLAFQPRLTDAECQAAEPVVAFYQEPIPENCELFVAELQAECQAGLQQGADFSRPTEVSVSCADPTDLRGECDSPGIEGFVTLQLEGDGTSNELDVRKEGDQWRIASF